MSDLVSSILVIGEVGTRCYMVITACHPAVGRQLTVGQAVGDVCIRCNRVGRDELLAAGVIVPPVAAAESR